MRQLTALDAQFLNVESPTTVGHVGSLIVLDPATAPGGRWDLESVREVFEPRLHLAAPLRQRLVEVPLGLGRPYWVDDPHFDIEFHLRELALPGPGTREQLGEQIARLHARQLDRSRPLWEAYVITGLENGRCAFYSKIHHAAIDGVSGAEILETIMDLSVEPREVTPEREPFVPRPMPSTANLIRRGVRQAALNPVELLATVPKSLRYVDQLPGAGNLPGLRLVSGSAALVERALGGSAKAQTTSRTLRPPRTPLNGSITPHRRFSFGSLPLSDLKLVKNHFGMTVNDVVMALTASALRRWLLDHDALPATPLVGAVPVSIRTKDQAGSNGNQVSVMLAELPTHLRDPEQRMEFMRVSMVEAKRAFQAVPASLLQDLSALVPTALSGLAARALFRLATVPGLPFNLFVSNVPGPQLPLFIAGAKVEGIYPVSAVTDMTGGLNITLFSYDGSLDFGLIACREMVPDLWNLIGYLQDAMAEMVALVPGHEAAADATAPVSGDRSVVAGSRAGSRTRKTGRSSATRALANASPAKRSTAKRSAAGPGSTEPAAAAKRTSAKRTSAKRAAADSGAKKSVTAKRPGAPKQTAAKRPGAPKQAAAKRPGATKQTTAKRPGATKQTTAKRPGATKQAAAKRPGATKQAAAKRPGTSTSTRSGPDAGGTDAS